MSTGRLEAFSDGVIAIIITIMVLELKAPHGDGIAALIPLTPVFLSYVLSFVNIAIYWNNHHHILHAAQHVNARVLWANMHLLFWLSLIPFTTAWVGENYSSALPTAVYGIVLLMSAASYVFLQHAIVKVDGPESPLARAVGGDRKGTISRLLYLIAIPSAFLRPWIAWTLYIVVAVIWFVPDRRIERTLTHEAPSAPH